MGDRGNIVVRQGNTNLEDVWFYTHWNGSGIKDVVRAALARRKRWNDESYLARIVFDELTSGQQGEETGFGISTGMVDNSHPILVVHVPNQVVYTVDEAELEDGRLPDDEPPKSAKSFEDFIKTPVTEG